MAYDADAGSSEGACLVIASNLKQAKPMAWPILSSWGTESYTRVVVRLMRDAESRLFPRDLAALQAGQAKAIETPETCPGCEMWGNTIMENGYCENCADDFPAAPTQSKEERHAD